MVSGDNTSTMTSNENISLVLDGDSTCKTFSESQKPLYAKFAVSILIVRRRFCSATLNPQFRTPQFRFRIRDQRPRELEGPNFHVVGRDGSREAPFQKHIIPHVLLAHFPRSTTFAKKIRENWQDIDAKDSTTSHTKRRITGDTRRINAQRVNGHPSALSRVKDRRECAVMQIESRRLIELSAITLVTFPSDENFQLTIKREGIGIRVDARSTRSARDKDDDSRHPLEHNKRRIVNDAGGKQ